MLGVPAATGCHCSRLSADRARTRVCVTNPVHTHVRTFLCVPTCISIQLDGRLSWCLQCQSIPTGNTPAPSPSPTGRILLPLPATYSHDCPAGSAGAVGLELQASARGDSLFPGAQSSAPLPLVSRTPLVPTLLQAAPFSSHSLLWVSDHRYFLFRCQKYRKAQEKIGKTPASPSRRPSVHVWLFIHPSLSTLNCTPNQSSLACLIISFIHREPAFPSL